MGKHEKKQKENNGENNTKKKKSKIYIIVMLALLCFYSAAGYIQYEYSLDLSNREKSVSAQIEKQKKIAAELGQQQQYYDSDEYVERIAREQLGLVKSNEVLFIDRNK